MREFFVQNETIILFAQGLVFFSLGFAVWLQRRRATRLTLSSSLIWLASFAFVEGLAVWGYAFVPIQEGYLSEGVVEGLMVLRGLVQLAAFVFLVQFGLRLLGLTPVVRRSLTGLSILAAAGIAAGSALAAEQAAWSASEWEAVVVSLGRYALLVPGAILSAVGLWRQRSELGAAGMTGIRPYAAAAAATLAVYGAVAGLVVAPGPVSPGGIGDAGGWFDAIALPVEVLRGIIGLALCVLAVPRGWIPAALADEPADVRGAVGEDDDARPEELHQPPLDDGRPGIAEHEGLHPGPRGVRRQRGAMVPRRGRHGLPEAEHPGHGERHGMEPVLERPRRVPRLVLQPDAGPSVPASRTSGVEPSARLTTAASAGAGELAEPPQAAGTRRPRAERALGGDRGIVVDDLERRPRLGEACETALEGRADRRHGAASHAGELRHQRPPARAGTTHSSCQPPAPSRRPTAVPGAK